MFDPYRLVERLLKNYTESDPSDERTRHSSGVAMLALVTTAPSKLKSCMTTLAPLSFVAKFSHEQAVKDIWEAVWVEITVSLFFRFFRFFGFFGFVVFFVFLALFIDPLTDQVQPLSR